MSAIKHQPVRGMRDHLPHDERVFQWITQCAQHHAALFGFSKMATPIIEPLSTFSKPLGESSDVVGKEMYVFQDRSGSPLVLRPEGTAAIVRSFLHAKMEVPQRLFYEGPMFRYERPQKGRQRQFHQVGCEILGDASPMADYELIAMSKVFLDQLRVPVVLEINTLGDQASRDHYRQCFVQFLEKHRHDLSEESQKRLDENPLRIWDSKSDNDQALLKNAPRLSESLTSVSRDRFERLKDLLTSQDIPFTYNAGLVRGLDYYDHTVFEWIATSTLGAQGTVLAGGCYHGLVALMGGGSVPGVGWAAGVERLALMANEEHLPPQKECFYLLPLSEKEWCLAARLAAQWQREGLAVATMAEGPLPKRLKKLHKKGVRWVGLLGDQEADTRTLTVRDLQESAQHTLSWDKIMGFFDTLQQGSSIS